MKNHTDTAKPVGDRPAFEITEEMVDAAGRVLLPYLKSLEDMAIGGDYARSPDPQFAKIASLEDTAIYLAEVCARSFARFLND